MDSQHRNGAVRAWLPVALAIGFTAVLLVPSLPAAAGAPATRAASEATAVCVGTALPVPAGTVYSHVTGGDPTGTYLLGEVVAPAPGQQVPVQQGVWWVRGQLRQFPADALQPYGWLVLADANRYGVVVGSRYVDTPAFHSDAWVYRHGRVTLLPALTAGDTTRAVAVNARGDIVGSEQPDNMGPVRAVIWPADRPGTVRALRVPDAPQWTYAYGVDEDATVLGWVGPMPGGQPYVWPAHGPGYLLPVPADSFTEATAIRNGWVAGASNTASAGRVIWWNLRTGGQWLVPGPGTVSAVNSRGTAAATGSLVYRDGRIVPLDGDPAVIADSGLAAGTGANRALVWPHC